MKIGDKVRLISKEKINHEWYNWIVLAEELKDKEYKIGDESIIELVEPGGYIRLKGVAFLHPSEKFEVIP